MTISEIDSPTDSPSYQLDDFGPNASIGSPKRKLKDHFIPYKKRKLLYHNTSNSQNLLIDFNFDEAEPPSKINQQVLTTVHSSYDNDDMNISDDNMQDITE